MSDTARSPSRLLRSVLGLSVVGVVLTIVLLHTSDHPLESAQVWAITGFSGLHLAVCLVVAVGWWPSVAGHWENSIFWFATYLWSQFWIIGFAQGRIESLLLLTVLGNFLLGLIVFDQLYQDGFQFSDTPLSVRLGVGLVLVGLVGATGLLFNIDWGAFGRSTITGVGLGSIYALAAIGFVIVYNTTDVLNFAQGALVMAGGYAIVLILDTGVGLGVAIAAMIVLGILGGLLLERFVFRHLIGASELSIIVVTLALIQVIPGILTILVGGQAYRGYPDALSLGSVGLPFGFSLQGSFLLAIVLALGILGVLVWFFRQTVVGPALRSAGSHQAAAAVLGISITQTIKLAWILAITLAMTAGVLLGVAQGGVHFAMDQVIILIFAAAIFGGLDSLVGAFVGSLTVGLLEIFGALYFVGTFGEGFSTILPMLFLLAVLMIKPSGLWGTERIERL